MNSTYREYTGSGYIFNKGYLLTVRGVKLIFYTLAITLEWNCESPESSQWVEKQQLHWQHQSFNGFHWLASVTYGSSLSDEELNKPTSASIYTFHQRGCHQSGNEELLCIPAEKYLADSERMLKLDISKTDGWVTECLHNTWI